MYGFFYFILYKKYLCIFECIKNVTMSDKSKQSAKEMEITKQVVKDEALKKVIEDKLKYVNKHPICK